MKPFPQIPQSSLEQLISKTKTTALARGAKAADWCDVWTAMTQVEAFDEVFAAHNIESHSMAAEIGFITRFRKELLKKLEFNDEDIRGALNEMKEEMTLFRQVMQAEDKLVDFTHSLSLIEKKLVDKIFQAENPREELRKAQLK